jgi:capsular polysaccharide biosynthesis protein
MSSPLSLPKIAPAHLDDAVVGMTPSQPKAQTTPAPTIEPDYLSHSVTLSFAFDIATKSLNVVMTDKGSGEVVRKMSYTHLPTDVHQSNKLHGLLLDQFA